MKRGTWKIGVPGGAVVLLWLLFGTFQVSGAGAAEPPQILDESVSGITETSAVLEARIDPGDGAVYYQFQLGPEREELPSELLCPSSTSAEPPCEGNQSTSAFPIEKLEGDAQTVEFNANGLNPGTPYRFRVLVAPAVDRDDDTIEWEEPIVVGMNKWFTTLGSAEPAPGPLLNDPIMTVSAPLLPKCRKAGMGSAGRCGCPGGIPPRKVNGKVRCAKPKGLPNFLLLRHPVGLSHLPRSLRFGLLKWLPPADPPVKTRALKLRGGTVYLGDVGVYGVGNPEAVCMRAWGGPGLRRSAPRGGASACAPMSHALKHGIAVVSSCTGTEKAVQVAGLVPSRITRLGVDRYATGEIEEVIPVKFNAFVLQLERVGVVLHGMGPAANGFKMKLPIRRLVPSPRCLK